MYLFQKRDYINYTFKFHFEQLLFLPLLFGFENYNNYYSGFVVSGSSKGSVAKRSKSD